MDVNFDYYKIFYYVGKYGSLTKAAQMLGRSQPNITRAMNNLEAQVGAVLLLRTKKGIAFTYEGEKLYQRVKLAYEQIILAEQELENSKNLEEGSVAIGASEIALHEILLPVLADFRREYPGITIKVTNESTPSSIRSLQEGLVDFALVTTPLSEGSFYKSVEVEEFQEYAVVAEHGFTFAGDGVNREIRWRDLEKYPLIMMAEGTATRKFYETLFDKHHTQLHPQMIAATADQIMPMVKAGLGIGFVPGSMLDNEKGISRLHLKEEIPSRKICLVTAADRPLGLAAQRLMERIVK